MTATPERMDNADVFKIFGNTTACEIRLQDALRMDLLCPFHYFGVSDILIDGRSITDKDIKESLTRDNFTGLISESRARHILEKADLYAPVGPRKGLIFVSAVSEAKELAEMINKISVAQGKKRTAVAVSAEDKQEIREKVVNRLSLNSGEDKLDYIISRDVFNEGIDIPDVNTVIFLRPTESVVVFVQQLGRGLRKYPNKCYVSIIDFIGSYENNYMITAALSGDRALDKDAMRKFAAQGSAFIPGDSVIYFDEIAKERIFKSIDSAKFDTAKFLLEKYNKLKNLLGRSPSLLEFTEEGEIDPWNFISYKTDLLGIKCNSYYAFQMKYDKDYQDKITAPLTAYENNVLSFVSKKFASGKRLWDLLLLSEDSSRAA